MTTSSDLECPAATLPDPLIVALVRALRSLERNEQDARDLGHVVERDEAA